MGYHYQNSNALYKVRALKTATTAKEVEQSMAAIADYVGTNISAQRLDANLRIESRRDITCAGGLEAIIKGMADFERNLAVQVAGCRALANLSHRGGYECKDYFGQSSNRRQMLIARSGGIDIVLKALDTHSYAVDDYNHTVACNTDLQEHACRALWALSFNPKVKKAIVFKGGISSIQTVVVNTARKEARSRAVFWAGLALKNLVNPERGGGSLSKLVVILGFLSGVGFAICLLLPQGL